MRYIGVGLVRGGRRQRGSLSATRFAILAATVSLLVGASGALAATGPTATTNPASQVTSTSATLNGTISPNNVPSTTTYYFQYGTSTSYGQQTPNQTLTQHNGNHKVSASVTGLTPGTTYHFRIVATGAGYALPVFGSDMTFTTAASGGPHGNNTVTINAPRAVTFGHAARITGKVSGTKAGVEVRLEADPYPYTGGFKETGLTTTTSPSGAYSIAVTPTVNTRYEVVAKTSPPVTSAVVAVRVRVRVTLHLSTLTPAIGQRVRFRGTVTPAHNGRFANIQKRTRTGRWRTVARIRLVAASPVNGVAVSKFSTRLRIRHDGSYRVRVNPHDGDHVTGKSPTRTVHVH